jgi:Rrf2 family protein
VFEVAKRSGQGPVKIDAIAKAQAIPPRFLAAILNQLKQGGFVQSRRGAEGGYFLSRSPEELNVGEIIRFIQGPVVPVNCMTEGPGACELHGDCPFHSMWERARKAVIEVYDSTTLREMIGEHEAKAD